MKTRKDRLIEHMNKHDTYTIDSNNKLITDVWNELCKCDKMPFTKFKLWKNQLIHTCCMDERFDRINSTPIKIRLHEKWRN